jgi:hypothetical protein
MFSACSMKERIPTSAAAGGMQSSRPRSLGDTIRLNEEGIARLRSEGLNDLEIADVIHCAAFFNWANRLMLSLGEPTPAAEA